MLHDGGERRQHGSDDVVTRVLGVSDRFYGMARLDILGALVTCGFLTGRKKLIVQ